MDKNGIVLKVRQLVAEEIGNDIESVAPDGDLAELGADSMNVVDIVMEMEDFFNFEMPEEDMQKVTSVADLINFTVSKVL